MGSKLDEWDGTFPPKDPRHPLCKGRVAAHYWSDGVDYECDYNTILDCGECKYGFGEKDPEAKCNQIESYEVRGNSRRGY